MNAKLNTLSCFFIALLVASFFPGAIQAQGVAEGVKAKSVDAKATEEAKESEEKAKIPAGSNPADFIIRSQLDAERKIRDFKRQCIRNISQNRMPLAIDNLKQLITLDPYEQDYQVTLGVLYKNLGNMGEARKKFKDFIDLGGSLSIAHLLIAETFATENNRDKVFEHLQKAAENGLNLMRAVKSSKSLAAFKGDTDFIKLALRLEQYTLSEIEDHRDPMTATFLRKNQKEEGVDGSEAVFTKWSRERQEAVLLEARDSILKIEIYLSQPNGQELAREEYAKLKAHIKQRDRITVPRFSSEFGEIVAKMSLIEDQIEEIRIKYFYDQGRRIVDDMQLAFRNQNYPMIDKQSQKLKRIGKEMVGVRASYKEVADRLFAAGDYWLKRSQIRREFNSIQLQIYGIVVEEGERVAVLNNRVVRIGEFVRDGMRITHIEQNQITFNYKGEVIPLIFRRY